MNNFIDYAFAFASQADADNAITVPLDVYGHPMTLIAAIVYLSAVGGSPTAVTIDVDLTDGTTTKAAIAAQSIGTAAGQSRLTPTAADQLDGTNTVAQDTDNNWRAEVDFNFTGGSSPTVTGTLVLRFAH